MCRSGDMCDDDKDGDNIPNDEDNCELTKNTDQGDIDEDGIGDECDNCPEIANKDQTDDNQNFIGDICELGIFHQFLSLFTSNCRIPMLLFRNVQMQVPLTGIRCLVLLFALGTCFELAL